MRPEKQREQQATELRRKQEQDAKQKQKRRDKGVIGGLISTVAGAIARSGAPPPMNSERTKLVKLERQVMRRWKRRDRKMQRRRDKEHLAAIRIQASIRGRISRRRKRRAEVVLSRKQSWMKVRKHALTAGEDELRKMSKRDLKLAVHGKPPVIQVFLVSRPIETAPDLRGQTTNSHVTSKSR